MKLILAAALLALAFTTGFTCSKNTPPPAETVAPAPAEVAPPPPMEGQPAAPADAPAGQPAPGTETK